MNTMYSTDKKPHHPVIELKQPYRQTHEKAVHQRKEQDQTIIWRYTLETKALMLTSQAMHKQNPTNAQVSKVIGINRCNTRNSMCGCKQ